MQTAMRQFSSFSAGLGIALAFICSLSGCALLQRDPPQASPIPATQVDLAEDIRLAQESWPKSSWWQDYRDAQLTSLIERALADSPGMRIARSRLEQASSIVALEQASTRFQASAVAQFDRQSMSSTGFLGPYGIHGPWYNEGRVGLGGKYAVDLWGKDEAQVNAALGAENAKVAEKAVAELEISTSVAKFYFGIQTELQHIDLLQQTRDIEMAIVAGHRARATRGLEPETLTVRSKDALLQTEQEISQAQSRAKQLREGLRALVGAHANDFPSISVQPLPSSLTGLPSSLSYELLSRRPDLQAMRWYVQSSLDQVQVAKAAFYPSFDIKAFVGLNSIEMKDLWQYRSRQLNFVPGLSLPIFDGGALNANLQRARSASNTLIEQYNQSVLNAVRDIAVTGARLQHLAKEQDLQNGRLETAEFTKDSVTAQYRQGLAAQVSAQEARLPVLKYQANLLKIRGQRLAEEITLTRELGGGYHRQLGELN